MTSTGSDSHGPGQPLDPLPFRAGWAKELLARLGVEVIADNPTDLIWQEGMSPKPAVKQDPTSSSDKKSKGKKAK